MIHIIFKDECPGRPGKVASILAGTAIGNYGSKYKERLNGTKKYTDREKLEKPKSLYNENGRKNYKK
jgi:hypothetical protein